MQHIDWGDLDTPVRAVIQRRTGRVHRVRTAAAGLNSQLALIVDATAGRAFVKGLPSGHPGVVRQHREAMINSHIAAVAPRLLWQTEEAGWDLAPRPAVDAFATASARLFAEIARNDPQPWKVQLAGAASQWLAYRVQGN